MNLSDVHTGRAAALWNNEPLAKRTFTALAVSREVQHRTQLAIRKVIRELRPLRSATLSINGAVQTFRPEIPTAHQTIIDALNRATVRH